MPDGNKGGITIPYKFEYTKLKIPRDKDRRVKLSLDDKANIREEYKTGKTSQRKLARKYNVSRRLIQFILDPEKEKINKIFHGYYYDKNKHRNYMRKHRHYKQELNLKNKLDKKK